MDILLILGVIVAAYLGAALVLLYGKKDYKEAAVPGTVALVIVIAVSFFIVMEGLVILLAALVVGAIAQLVMAKK